MLPPSISEKLRERRDLVSLQQYIHEIDLDLGRLNDSKLVKIHAQRMSNALKPGSRTSVNAAIEEQTQSVPVHQDMNDGNVEIVKKLDTLIAALINNNQPRGRAEEDPAARISNNGQNLPEVLTQLGKRKARDAYACRQLRHAQPQVFALACDRMRSNVREGVRMRSHAFGRVRLLCMCVILFKQLRAYMFVHLVLLYMCVHPSVSQTGPDGIVILYMCVILFKQLRAFRQTRL